MDYKSAILKGLHELVQTLPKDSPVIAEYGELRRKVEAEQDRRTLFFMWQSMREALSKVDEQGGVDTTFQVKTKEGNLVTYHSLDEMAKDQGLVPVQGSGIDHDRP